MKKPFWKYTPLLRPSDFNVNWIYAHLLERSFRTKETVTRYYNAGTLRPKIAIEEVLEELHKLGGHTIKHHHGNRHANPDWVIQWDDTAVEIEHWPKNRGFTATLVSCNEALGLALRTYFDGIIVRTQTKGRVYVVTSGQQGPKLTEMGVAGEEFIPSNYRPESVEQYRHIIADLNKNDPCGRIVLLDGPPGTGKTHMVRAMLNEVPKGTFILVPSNFIASLGDPTFLNLLLREQKKDCPMILILEDADEAVIVRKEGTPSAISALLNFSDGIFGALLNMRLVCTTNIDIKNVDEAVIRDGRLCTRLEIGLLDTAMANAIFERITGKKGELKDKLYRLGTVYKIAKGDKPNKIDKLSAPKSQLGFLPEPKVEEREGRVGDTVEVTYQRVGDQIVKTGEKFIPAEETEEQEEIEFKGEPGEKIQAVDGAGKLIDVGYIDEDGNLVITDDAFEKKLTEDDDDDLIDEDPDDDDDEEFDANVMPEYLDPEDDDE